MKYTVTKVVKCSQRKPEGAIRVLCMSDTHEKHDRIPLHQLSPCDILIYAGDFTRFGEPEACKVFCDWLLTIDATYRVVIAGNHETTFDDPRRFPLMAQNMSKMMVHTKMQLSEAKKIVQETEGIIYLEDESIEIMGLNIYGSPRTTFWKDWAFFYPDSEGDEVWSHIPDDTDILITHNIPSCKLDLCDGKPVGCVALKRAVERVQPCLHVFGHLHEGYGVTKIGNTVAANVSIVNKKRHVANRPMLFDITKKAK